MPRPKTATTAPGAAVPSPRDRILTSAHDLFYCDGIRATGIDGVIAASGVAKATFYRHFPSKDDLILAFLDHRHARWMAWFTDALRRHGGGGVHGIDALVPALAEWFGAAGYRGCAFINSVTELGAALPEVMAISRRHKDDMTTAIAALLPPSRSRAKDARAIAVAVDGAIIQAQFGETPAAALEALARILKALRRPPG